MNDASREDIAARAAGAYPVVVAERVSKRFLATQALVDVTFALAAGEVHGLIGENGAGKSTLIKILCGVYQPDSGALRIDGRAVRLASPRAALESGIVMIPQEMRVVPALTVAENVLLGRLPSRTVFGALRLLDRKQMRARTEQLLSRLNLAVDPDLRIDRLGYAERQLVMIARALNQDARVLILDEPTAALETREVDRLFAVIGHLKSRGVAVVFVSHRLDEVERIADICTVLRDGAAVGAFRRGAIGRDEMVRLMTGRDLESLHARTERAHGALLLEFEHRAVAPADGEVAVREGEIVGLAGLLGSGTSELLHRLFGAGRDGAGITLRGRRTTVATPRDAIRHGVGLVPSERRLGLVPALTVRENIVLPNLDKLSRGLRLDRRAVDRMVAELIESLDIRPRDPDKPVRELSGGNQQKVIFARWIASHAELLLLDEPTHGIDVGAKAQIHRLMQGFAARGGGVLLASSEMIEVLSISDRVIVMRHGDIVARLSREGAYNEQALRTALGG